MTKFSIMNYSSTILTQPLYFHHFLNSIEDCKSIVFPNANDVFLVYDEFKPDYSIINVGADIDNIVAYNQETPTKIKHILNLDYISQQDAKMVGGFLKQEVKEDKLSCVLLFSANMAHKEIDFGHPYVHVPNCADTNIVHHKRKFKIDNAIIIEKKEDKKEYEDNELEKMFDNMPLHMTDIKSGKADKNMISKYSNLKTKTNLDGTIQSQKIKSDSRCPVCLDLLKNSKKKR